MLKLTACVAYVLTRLDKRIYWHWVPSTSGRHTIGHKSVSQCANSVAKKPYSQSGDKPSIIKQCI